MKWIEEKLRQKFRGYPCALPPHLIHPTDGIGLPHKDWPSGFKWVPRSWNARGPRCGEGNPGYKKWPPYLVKGKGVSRWETDGARSIIWIPGLDNKEVTSKDIYDNIFQAVEMNPGHPKYQKNVYVKLFYKEEMNLPHQYHPSALQRFSDKGYMKCNPSYYARWKLIKRLKDEEDLFWFVRWGWRVDSLDKYYNYGPMVGRKMD